jgi:hypothetical protein
MAPRTASENVMNFTTIDWSTAILVASIALLVWGIGWKLHLRAGSPAPAPDRNGIGQYRPQVYR